jgi:NAD(P)-dependent dehydrogenase (short-subunit alcohol dehydrogenase family)
MTMRPLAEIMDLSGRKALVTGGAGHIGLAVTEALVELGATVSILDVDAAACEKRVERLSALREHSAVGLTCDLSDEQETRQAIQETVSRLGGLDILVHCAAYGVTAQGTGWTVPFEQQTVEAWDAAIRINLTAPFVLAQEALEHLAASGHGSIILIASIYGMAGPDMGIYTGTNMENPAGYGASKGGLIQLTRHLATVLAPKVRVNAISPGGVWRDQPDAFYQRYIARTPLHRMAKEEDLKGAVAYLASDLSEYVTGHNLVVDGGWTAW